MVTPMLPGWLPGNLPPRQMPVLSRSVDQVLYPSVPAIPVSGALLCSTIINSTISEGPWRNHLFKPPIPSSSRYSYSQLLFHLPFLFSTLLPTNFPEDIPPTVAIVLALLSISHVLCSVGTILLCRAFCTRLDQVDSVVACELK
jgi:hypothetical protein